MTIASAKNEQQILRRHWLLLGMLVLLGISAEYSGLDLWLARHFYDAGAGVWPYREHWLAKGVLHEGAKKFLTVLAVGLIATAVASCFVARLKPMRRSLWILI